MAKASKKTAKTAVKPKPTSLAKQAPAIPKIGEPAPDFQLPDQHGHPITLSKLKGTKIVLYFYPKDDTPGCTIEAKGFNQDIKEFQKKGVMVFGISKDDQKSHCKFIEKYRLQFQLLSDSTGDVIKRYGCWVEKSMYGKKYMGIQRATFLIDDKGKITQVWPTVTPEGHSKEILAKL